jgi:hypothetical protein
MLAFPVTQKRSVPRVSSLNDEPTQKSWLIIITNNMVKKRKRRKFQNYEPPRPATTALTVGHLLFCRREPQNSGVSSSLGTQNLTQQQPPPSEPETTSHGGDD